MLQVARLAPNLLQEATDKVAEFLNEQWNEDGGACDRAGASDLYYTVFTLEGLTALQRPLPAETVLPWLERFGTGEGLDLVHLGCLVRAWKALGEMPFRGEEKAVILSRLEQHRSADGLYSPRIGAETGTAYHAFLALGAYEDFDEAIPDSGKLLEGLAALRTEDGGYSNDPVMRIGAAPATAAAVVIQHRLDVPMDREVGQWLLAQSHDQGGFKAIPQAPIPDLLSTAVVLHALATLEVSFESVKEKCLDFVDSLWTGRAFCGNWTDDDTDSEYLWYGLLALGHLSL
ncbi:MAG: prenyltransferase/squalene oxidase repeat-containing protein [Planctomycetota bacterium]